MNLPFVFRAKTDHDPLLEAMELRTLYGEDAEQWCEIGILAAGRLSRRRALYRVRDALRLVPTDDLPPLDARFTP